MISKMLMAVACLGAAIASAQTLGTVRVTLPVDANVGHVTLPAGHYSVHELNDSVLQFTSDDHKGVSTFVTAMPILAPNQAAVDHTGVVLREKETGYQVDKIWLQGQDMGFELATE
jgi:hypothetical protein